MSWLRFLTSTSTGTSFIWPTCNLNSFFRLCGHWHSVSISQSISRSGFQHFFNACSTKGVQWLDNQRIWIIGWLPNIHFLLHRTCFMFVLFRTLFTFSPSQYVSGSAIEVYPRDHGDFIEAWPSFAEPISLPRRPPLWVIFRTQHLRLSLIH